MQYDIIFVSGELFFDHPLSGIALLKRLLEKHGYTVGVIEMPQKEADVTKLGKPKLFFGVSSGAIDSMVRNYTPLKKLRKDDKHLDYNESVPDRAVIVYSNWLKHQFKDSMIVLGGTEASVRRFVHYDYWDNKLRKPILFDSKTPILAYGSAEKQILEIAARLKHNESIEGIPGTCIIAKEKPEGMGELPSYDEVVKSKEKFCEMQNKLDSRKDLCQKIDNRYAVQFRAPFYTSQDLDGYYELPFTRKVTSKHLRGFEFSVVTHRGCIGECNFCSLNVMMGNKVISRSEKSILREIEAITKLPYFKGNIDDLGGPSANMYGMDCELRDSCSKSCLTCPKLDRSNKRLIALLRKARQLPGIKHIYIRSGVYYGLASPEYMKEICEHHLFDFLRIAPEHVNKNVLRLMNKDYGDLPKFIEDFKNLKTSKKLSFYFMTAHPGSGMKEANELHEAMKELHIESPESVQVFTPTPMTVSTCMYYTGMDPKTNRSIHVPYTYSEKKRQKRALIGKIKQKLI